MQLGEHVTEIEVIPEEWPLPEPEPVPVEVPEKVGV